MKRILVTAFVLTTIVHAWYAVRPEREESRKQLALSGEEFLASMPTWNTDPEMDSAFYNRSALGVLATGIPRDRQGEAMTHAPLYPYFLAACYRLGGFRWLSVLIPQALLAGSICVLLALIAARLAPERAQAAAAVAAALYLLNIRVAGYVGLIYPTIPLMMLWSVAMLAAMRGRLAILVPAIVLGILTHAAFFVIALAVALWAALQGKDRRYLIAAVLIAGAAVSKVGVEFYRNAARPHDGAVVPQSPSVMWEANNPCYEGMPWYALWERRGDNPFTESKLTTRERERAAEYLQRAGGDRAAAAVLWVRENPGQYLKLCLIRLRTELSPFTAGTTGKQRAIFTLLWLVTFPAGLVGMWRQRRSPITHMVALAGLAIVAFGTLVIEEWYLRYRLPLELALMVFAATTYARWIRAKPVHPS